MFEFLVDKGIHLFRIYMTYGEIFFSAIASFLLYRCGKVGFSFGIYAFAYTVKLFVDMFWMYFAVSFDSNYAVTLWYSGFLIISILFIHCVYRAHLRLGVTFSEWTCIGLLLEFIVALLQLIRYIERVFFSTSDTVSLYRYGIPTLSYGCDLVLFFGVLFCYLRSREFPERIPWKIGETDRK